MLIFEQQSWFFFKAFNSIFGKIGHSASEEVVFELVKSKCLPLYGLDVCPSNSADRHSLQFSVNKIIYKIFGAMAKDSYGQISEYFGIPSVKQLIILIIVIIDSLIDIGVKKITNVKH